MSGSSRLATPSEVPTATELDPDREFRVAGRTTVLIVEDDGRIRAMARRVLSGQAYRVLEAVNGADAIRIATKQGAPIDLVLTDVEMPTIGARAMLGRLTQLNAAIRVVFMSGYSDAELLARGFDKGYDLFLPKPFSGSDLVATVGQALRMSSV